MHTNEEIICRAEIDCKTSRFPILTFITGIFIAFIADQFMILKGFQYCWFGWEDFDIWERELYVFYLFKIPIVMKDINNGKLDFSIFGIILSVVSLTFIIAFPIIVSRIKRHNYKSSFLYLTKDCIYGFRKTMFRKKAVQIKLENLSDIFSYSSVRDSTKKVETLYISYEGGEITFRNLKNAQEFVEAVRNTADRKMHIEHIAMYVNDIETEKAFFEKYFGGKSGDMYHNQKTGFRSYFLTFENGARLELMNRADISGKSGNSIGYAHIAFSLGSRERVDQLTQRLKNDGFEVISGPRVTGDGYYESCVLDGEGNAVELTE